MSKNKLGIVLLEPEIPPNTGNIVRTCVATGTGLHLIKPLGFSLEDKQLKRAGLDYWQYLNFELHDNLESFMDKYGHRPLYYATTKAGKKYTEVKYEPDALIIFGKETQGLPKNIVTENMDKAIKIPMEDNVKLRSLNLGNSAAIILYEALRQLSFPSLL